MTASSPDSRSARPSVLDVAAACNVSPSTVCRALNERSDINTATRQRVLAACERLGYSRNSAAQMLRLRRSDAIACLVSDFSNEVFMEKLHCLEQAVQAAGFRWRMFLYQDEAEVAGLLAEIVSGNPAGLIVRAPITDEQVATLACNRIATVCYDESHDRLDAVELDRASGVQAAVAHALAGGRERLLMLGFSLESSRGRGCLQALAARGLAAAPELVWNVPFGRDLFAYGYEQAGLAWEKVRFDALHAVNDAAALGAMRKLHELGVRVPADVTVSGMDNIAASAYGVPSLTTVEQPKAEMAAAAVRLLVRRMQDPNAPRQCERLVTTAVIRES